MSPLAARTESVDADRWCTGNVLLHCDRGDDSRLSQHARDRQICVVFDADCASRHRDKNAVV
jgi:hypothetical protein